MQIRAMLACALAIAAVFPAAAGAHEGNPNYRSEIEAIDPDVPGIDVEVLNYDDSLRLTNDSGEDVTIFGYEDEPYVRIAADGTVEVNRNSPAFYLNEDRFADIDVPASADPEAEPDWDEVDKSGAFAWHDHRSHYMGEGTPEQVGDKSKRQKVFDYEIPLEVGGEPAAVVGELIWVGEDDETPILPFIGLGVAAIVLIAVAVVVRRRRSGDGGDSELGEAGEAW